MNTTYSTIRIMILKHIGTLVMEHIQAALSSFSLNNQLKKGEMCDIDDENHIVRPLAPCEAMKNSMLIALEYIRHVVPKKMLRPCCILFMGASPRFGFRRDEIAYYSSRMVFRNKEQ